MRTAETHHPSFAPQRERRYEPRERTRIQALERAIARERAMKEAEERDKVEMRARLDVWDDDESDEPFYTDRARWRGLRARRLAAEQTADEESRMYEEREAENLRRESEAFLARQMDEMQALQEEQRKAGMLLDDGAPVKLSVSLAPAGQKEGAPKEKAAVFGQEEEEGWKGEVADSSRKGLRMSQTVWRTGLGRWICAMVATISCPAAPQA